MKSQKEVEAWLKQYAPMYFEPSKIVASKVCGWTYKRRAFYDANGRWMGADFNPFTRLDDAAHVLGAITDFKIKRRYTNFLVHTVCESSFYDDFSEIFEVLNASARQRMVALFMAMPELMEVEV